MTLHEALGDVAHLVLDHKIGVPLEHLDDVNEHIATIREFANAPVHEQT